MRHEAWSALGPSGHVVVPLTEREIARYPMAQEPKVGSTVNNGRRGGKAIDRFLEAGAERDYDKLVAAMTDDCVFV